MKEGRKEGRKEGKKEGKKTGTKERSKERWIDGIDSKRRRLAVNLSDGVSDILDS